MPVLPADEELAVLLIRDVELQLQQRHVDVVLQVGAWRPRLELERSTVLLRTDDELDVVDRDRNDIGDAAGCSVAKSHRVVDRTPNATGDQYESATDLGALGNRVRHHDVVDLAIDDADLFRHGDE